METLVDVSSYGFLINIYSIKKQYARALWSSHLEKRLSKTRYLRSRWVLVEQSSFTILSISYRIANQFFLLAYQKQSKG